MLRRCVVTAVIAGVAMASACRTSLEDEPDAAGNALACKLATSPSCLEAVDHSDLAWIEQNVFVASCAFSGCHNGTATPAGMINLKVGMSHAALVDIESKVEPGRKLVVAGQTKQSYLMMMVRHFSPAEMEPTPVAAPPATVGFMPQNAGGAVLCCQKLDALDRWITAGALNN